jgi:competence protein ComEA
MKTWQVLILGILIGLLASAGILIVASEPRGEPIQLLPAVTPTEIVIYISGGVAHPGVYHLSPGSRIEQAVTAAGGLSTGADSGRADLARLLTDGDQVYIPSLGEMVDSSIVVGNSLAITSIDINSATVEELDSLPGIGTVKAQSIITYRETHGNFTSLDDLLNVPGIGVSLLEQIKPYLFISP